MNRIMRIASTVAALVAAAFGLAAPAAEDHAHHHPHHHQAPKSAPRPAPIAVSDAALVNQDGRPVKFKTEALGDKIVVMDFVYTTCTTICPVLSALLAQVQNALGERLGADVRLVTVTVDPVRDTPARLKAYGAKHGAKPGWTWLTGATGTVNGLLQELDVYAADFTQHQPVVMVGDARANQWTRFYGFPSPADILAKVDELTHARAMTDASDAGRSEPWVKND